MATHAAPSPWTERLRESRIWQHAPRITEELARLLAIIAMTMILVEAGMVMAGLVLFFLGLGTQVAILCWQWIKLAETDTS